MGGLERYSKIKEKNPREIVLLRGRGCIWKRCSFCDYHLDASRDESENLEINSKTLSRVTGEFKRLEVINSGSFAELDESTKRLVEQTSVRKGIRDLHIETHWILRNTILELRERFSRLGIRLHVKTGVETFDAVYREKTLVKGISETDPSKIAENFDECCLLFGLEGQTKEGMENDIETGLKFFDRVCVNIMVPNTTGVNPDRNTVEIFLKELYPVWKDDKRVDILLDNTDFGVGGTTKDVK